MPRLQLFEIHDQRWCPRALRDASTDFLQFLACTLGYFAPAIEPLLDELEEREDTRVLDLCSGAGGPWLGILARLPASRRSGLRVLLSDLYPNLRALRRASRKARGTIEFVEQPVDAMRVPAALAGARTLFGSFHHFRPAQARAILADACGQGRPIGVFEPQERRALSLLSIFALPLILLVVTPFMRPFRFSRLLFTYLIPLVPLVVFFDGIVSCLRTYSPAELRTLVEDLGEEGYSWRIGRARMPRLPLRVTYLVGLPTR